MGSRNYSREFRDEIVAQANDPRRSIAEVAQEHGLNANMISRWRRSQQDQRPLALATTTEGFVPVQIASEARQPSVVVIERGPVRVRFEGALDVTALQTVLAALRAAA
ncbi:IS66-like element accessory protein TnpA [Pararobbsia alpina]|uniref:IS66-like element accessory protein TnpA n=1 Tax=Pararobbsia alpina TaxID=621374 RepID=UPI001FE9ADE5|nr:transposase [Pararobbsia alpina]